MKLNDFLYQSVEEKAARVSVDCLCVGLGYTLVSTSEGGLGLAYTYFADKSSCTLNHEIRDPEGRSAEDLLPKIFSADPLQRSIALALINALNHERANQLPSEPENQTLLDALDFVEGSRVAMVGLFKPLIPIIKDRGGTVEVLDRHKNLGESVAFYKKMATWADILILSATSILNQTTEEVLAQAGQSVKTVLLGPSTPMIPDAFRHLPVHYLAGTVPIDKEQTMKAVRHGKGTPVLQRYGRKVMLSLV